MSEVILTIRDGDVAGVEIEVSGDRTVDPDGEMTLAQVVAVALLRAAMQMAPGTVVADTLEAANNAILRQRQWSEDRDRRG